MRKSYIGFPHFLVGFAEIVLLLCLRAVRRRMNVWMSDSVLVPTSQDVRDDNLRLHLN